MKTTSLNPIERANVIIDVINSFLFLNFIENNMKRQYTAYKESDAMESRLDARLLVGMRYSAQRNAAKQKIKKT